MAATVATGPAHGKVSAIYLDGIDLSGRSRDINTSVDGGSADITGMGSSATAMWRSFLVGLRGWTNTIQGIYEIADVGNDDEIVDALDDIVLNDSIVLSVMHLGDEIGRVAAFAGQEDDAAGNVIRASFSVQGAVEDAVIINGEQSGKGSLLWGQCLQVKEAISDAHVSADSLDNPAAASSSNGAVGFQHVFTMTGGETVTGKIRDSADDITFGDLIDFAAVAAAGAPIAESVAVGGTVERYVNYEADLTVGGGNTATVAAGFVRL